MVGTLFTKRHAAATLNAGNALKSISHNHLKEGTVVSNYKAVNYLLET